MEKYLAKCLDSLIIPEFDKVEVLIVNDGSKDNSLQIAKEYEGLYPLSIKVIDKINGNYGSCINAALPQVSGRYVKILDADDSFDTEAFSYLVSILSEIYTDAIITGYAIVNDNGKIISKYGLKNFKRIQSNVPYRFEKVEGTLASNHLPMYRIIYKTDIFRKFKYKQTEGISYTDTEWAIIPMSFCESVTFLDIMLYKYLVGRENQTMDAKFDEKRANVVLSIINGICKKYLNNKNEKNKYFLQSQLARLHHFPYIHFSKVSQGLPIIKQQDTEIKEIDPFIYDLIGKLNYEPYIKFKFIQRIRKSGYSRPLYLSFLDSLWISLNYRIHNCKK